MNDCMHLLVSLLSVFDDEIQHLYQYAYPSRSTSTWAGRTEGRVRIRSGGLQR
jgi:hypothetical protein